MQSYLTSVRKQNTYEKKDSKVDEYGKIWGRERERRVREGTEKEQRIRGFGEREKEWKDRVRGKKREGEEKEEGGE